MSEADPGDSSRSPVPVPVPVPVPERALPASSAAIAASNAPNDEGRPNVAKVRALLDKIIRVTLTDGRVVEGHFECYDKLGNIIMGDAHEVRPDNSRFAIGLVLAPANAITRICVRRQSAQDERATRNRIAHLRINN